MKDNSNIKDKWLHVRLSEAEKTALDKAFSKTTERKMSRYLRKILFGEPMISGYRDLSSEAFLEEFSTLLKTVNGIANNYNQSVHKLHTLDHVPQVKLWLEANKKMGETMLAGIEEIKSLMKKLSAKWLQ